MDDRYYITGSANLSHRGLRSNFESATAFKGGQACAIGLWRWSTMFEDVQHSMDQRLSFPTKSKPPESSLYQSLKEKVQLFSAMQGAFATMRRQDTDLDTHIARRYALAHETNFHMQFMLLQSMFTSALQDDAGQAMFADAYIALNAPVPTSANPPSNDQAV